jgi:hypothetical protein
VRHLLVQREIHKRVERLALMTAVRRIIRQSPPEERREAEVIRKGVAIIIREPQKAKEEIDLAVIAG